jgi:mannosyl-oligosaccharide alpha-1,2-mannosidase
MALIPLSRRPIVRLVLLASIVLIASTFLFADLPYVPRKSWFVEPKHFDWRARPWKHPLQPGEIVPLPSGPPRKLRRIQHDFSSSPPQPDAEARMKENESRRRAVRNSFRKAWESYKNYAYGFDELMPISLKGKNSFAGWAATIVDSLDVLWIMEMGDEFQQAVSYVHSIDWDRATASSCSVFETNIRYMGGLLAAADLSQDGRLVDAAFALGHVLITAFDTENHLPVNTLHFGKAKSENGELKPSAHESSANLGSLSLEFIRLSQLTGEPRFFSLIDRIKRELERTQDRTLLPGMWPRYINLRDGFLTDDNVFSINAPADSLYEYLGKTYALLGGLDPAYERMFREAMETVRKNTLFRPILPGDPDVLMTGVVTVGSDGNTTLTPEVQHLGCFSGGMFLLGGRLFGIEDYVNVGEKLTLGCVWAYNATPTGIMPEQFSVLPCDPRTIVPEAGSKYVACSWAAVAQEWETGQYRKNPQGFTSLWDTRYILRPEAIESLFYLYRVTGRSELQDMAWDMFLAVRDATETSMAFSAIKDVMAEGNTAKSDSMEVRSGTPMTQFRLMPRIDKN